MFGLSGIPLGWKVGVIVFGLLSFVAGIGGTYIYVLNFGEEKGAKDCQFKAMAAANEATVKAYKEAINEVRKLQTTENEILSSPESENRPVSGILRDQLVRMRNSQH